MPELPAFIKYHIHDPDLPFADDLKGINQPYNQEVIRELTGGKKRTRFGSIAEKERIVSKDKLASFRHTVVTVSCKICQGDLMPERTPDQPHNDSPTAAEVFHVFRNTTMASIEGLKLLLEECADLRAELVTIHSPQSDGEGDGVFSARQQNRILELQEAATQMDEVLASLPHGASDGEDGNGE